MAGTDSDSIARGIARFAVSADFSGIPDEVVERAKLFLLDAVGIGLASTRYDFSRIAAAAVRDLAGDGGSTVIGHPWRLPLRDAVLLNGVLVHGLDFDDTHPEGVVHASASAVPTAIAVGESLGVSGSELLAAYILGIEVDARVGAAAQGGFHQVGFHPTGLVGAFGAAVIAARLHGDDVDQTVAAQGIVGSFASGSLEFLETGAWTKRAHPGWAGVAGITAEAFARQGFVAPERIYEGRFGLYASHLGDRPVRTELILDGLGDRWEAAEIAVKPFPACHFTHAFADAVLAVRAEHGIRPDEIASIRCRIAEGEIKTVCEPRENKLAPRSSYDAQFSLPYVVAASMVRGRFTLAELDDASLADPEILELGRRVSHEADPESAFPKAYSGEVIVTTTDGRVLSHREQVNRGAGSRPLSREDVEEKFRTTAGPVVGPERTADIIAAVNELDRLSDVGEFAALLAAP